MQQYTNLAISNPHELLFGTAPRPLTTRRGLVIGGGTVYPEVNFTLPTTTVSEDALPALRDTSRDIVEGVCRRTVELETEGVVIEFEALIEMTASPHIAVELTAVMNEVLETWHARHGLKSALRATINDTRELTRPPHMRSGPHLEAMMQAFEGCAAAGADLLSIESTGGKEIHDNALLTCDIAQVLFALTVMGVRDMRFLWDRIVACADNPTTFAAGDTACGFGNTAMVLAEKRYIPRVFAAVVRAVTAVRSLVAYEQGAVGPGKDCGYENPYLKAITGYPMSMEGKTAACAHLSPVGNVAAATADLWSNESVQNVKLLGGMTPTIYAEQLVYDCRLMNTAARRGEALTLRDQLVASDIGHDPQALVLAPDNVIRIAQAIVAEPTPVAAGKAAALEALAVIEEAVAHSTLKLSDMEATWPAMLRASLEMLPSNEQQLIDAVAPTLDMAAFRPEDYELSIG
ncbi:MAG: methanol--corrinoid methyltransferase [Chitinivibrionales bacterium]|nr:methanol--corrinoid methyltransferase [Chitinivibrionales bacterium]